MFNFHNKKTRQIVTAVLVVVVILAMVIPTLTYIVS